MLKSLDLFSGIGGITLALKGLCKPVAYCEIDPHAQRVLNARMDDGMLPRAAVFDDVRTLTRKQLAPDTHVDIIVGGWPCQDLSVIGLRKRFFCLLIRPGWSHVFSGAGYQGRSWRHEPARMFPKHGGKPKDHRNRMEMMGNAVVPDCVRAAFITLATGFHTLPSLLMAATASNVLLQCSCAPWLP